MTDERLKKIRDQILIAKGQSSGFLLDDKKLSRDLHEMTNKLFALIIELCDEVERLKKITNE